MLMQQKEEGEKLKSEISQLKAIPIEKGHRTFHDFYPHYDQDIMDDLESRLKNWEKKTRSILKVYLADQREIDEITVSTPSEWNDFKEGCLNGVKVNLTALDSILERLEFLKLKNANNIEIGEKPHKVFISHSSEDKEFVEQLVSLIEFLGADSEEKLFCSSVSGYEIPVGNSVYDYLRKQFTEHEVYVIFVYSHNYFKSAACLNEMGAAWVQNAKFFPILISGFEIEDLKGALDGKYIVARVGGGDIKARLNELKENICEFFGKEVSMSRWETRRDMFLTTVKDIRSVSSSKKTTQVPAGELLEQSYIPIFNQIFEKLDLDHYSDWSYGWAISGTPKLSVKIYDSLTEDIPERLKSIPRNSAFTTINVLLDQLVLLLKDFWKMMMHYSEEDRSGTFTVPRFYNAKPNNPNFDALLVEYKEVRWLFADIMFEQTRMLNALLDEIRKIIPTYLNQYGHLTIRDEDIERTLYNGDEFLNTPYTGLKDYVEDIRFKRSYHMGSTNDIDSFRL